MPDTIADLVGNFKKWHDWVSPTFQGPLGDWGTSHSRGSIGWFPHSTFGERGFSCQSPECLWTPRGFPNFYFPQVLGGFKGWGKTRTFGGVVRTPFLMHLHTILEGGNDSGAHSGVRFHTGQRVYKTQGGKGRPTFFKQKGRQRGRRRETP